MTKYRSAVLLFFSFSLLPLLVKARYYDPNFGEFLTTDANGNWAHHQGNAYAAFADPLNAHDPMGLDEVLVDTQIKLQPSDDGQYMMELTYGYFETTNPKEVPIFDRNGNLRPYGEWRFISEEVLAPIADRPVLVDNTENNESFFFNPFSLGGEQGISVEETLRRQKVICNFGYAPGFLRKEVARRAWTYGATAKQAVQATAAAIPGKLRAAKATATTLPGKLKAAAQKLWISAKEMKKAVKKRFKPLTEKQREAQRLDAIEKAEKRHEALKNLKRAQRNYQNAMKDFKNSARKKVSELGRELTPNELRDLKNEALRAHGAPNTYPTGREIIGDFVIPK